jgi:flagellar hook-associated protein 3 FlgL
MRVTQSEIYRNFLANLTTLNDNLYTLTRQASSGQKLNRLMDSPADSAERVSLKEQAMEIDQYRSNMDTASFFLNSAESALNEVHQLITSIYTLGAQAASESVSSNSRVAIAEEIRVLRDQILSLANTQVRGRYLFAGSNVLTQPFTLSGDEVSYNGNGAAPGIAVDDGVVVSGSVPGSTAFESVFSDITALLTAAGGDDLSSIKSALDQFSSALTDLGLARAQIGSHLSALEYVASNLNSKELSTEERRSKLEDADIAAVAVQLSQNQTALQAAISVGGSVMTKDNLFDFLG